MIMANYCMMNYTNKDIDTDFSGEKAKQFVQQGGTTTFEMIEHAIIHDRPGPFAELVNRQNASMYSRASGRSLIHEALYNDDDYYLKYLIEHGADVEAMGFDGIRPLHIAAFYNKVNAARILLESGALIAADQYVSIFMTLEVRTPLKIAIEKGNYEMVAFLVEKGAEIPSNAKSLTNDKRVLYALTKNAGLYTKPARR